MAESVGAVALDIVAGKNTVNSVVKGAMNDVQDTVNKSSSGISNTLGKIGNVAGAVGKTVAVGFGVASTAVVALGKEAIASYANYEQLVGGVETLFKDSADTVIKNAEKAYITAGMSANQYMETVTSFSASLLQSLGNDTVKASEMADMAVTDMADNANKMGTSIEMIQNAYQGFAKQNYTMLDNLKIGYGGTKSEMERLLADAEKFSGIKYDISSYADVVDAIHVIQTEMGITGTTAKEASGTISGSLSMMKSSWQNLLTGMSGDGNNFDGLIDNFVSSVLTVADNIMPRLTTTLNGITRLITGLAPKLMAEIPNLISQILPALIDGAVSLVQSLVDAIPQLIEVLLGALPQLITGLQNIINSLIQALPSLIQVFVTALPTIIPTLIDALISIIVTICNMIPQIIVPLVQALPTIIISVVDALMSNLPTLIDGVIAMVIGIVQALPQIIIALVEAIPTIITSVISGLLSALPQLIEGCILLVVELVKALPQIIMALIEAIPMIITGIVEALFGASPELYTGFTTIFTEAWGFICDVFSVAGEWFGNLFTNIVDNIKTAFTAVVGVVSEIWGAIKNVFASVSGFFADTFTRAVNNVKSVFGVIVDFFSEIWTKVKGIFNKVGEVMGNAISNTVGKAVNAVLSVAVGLINGFLNAINLAIGAINLIPGVSIGKLGLMEVPKMERGGILEKGQVGLLEGNGAEAVVPLEKNTEWLTRVADILDTRMISRGTFINPPALNNVKAGNNTVSTDGGSKLDYLIELLTQLLDKDTPDTTIPIYIGNELIDEYILNKNSRQTIRSGGYA